MKDLLEFIVNNRFEYSPISALEILRQNPKAKFIRSYSFWYKAGYSVKTDAVSINVPLPQSDFSFMRNGVLVSLANVTDSEKQYIIENNVKLQSTIKYNSYPMFNIKDTDCSLSAIKFRVPKDINLKCFALLRKLNISIVQAPIFAMHLSPYYNGKNIVIDEAAQEMQQISQILASLCEYITVKTTDTNVDEQIEIMRFFLSRIVNKDIFTKEAAYFEQLDINNIFSCITKAVKATMFLLQELNVNINIAAFENLDNQIQTQDTPFKNRKRKGAIKK